MSTPIAGGASLNGFTRLTTLCLFVLVLLGFSEWVWVAKATRPLEQVPQRLVLVTTQRLHAIRLTSSTIASMQAPDSAARVPYLREREAARSSLLASQPALAALVRLTAAEGLDDRALREVQRLVTTMLAQSDRELEARVAGRRGPLQEQEIRAAIVRNDSVIAAIDEIKAAQVEYAERASARLERGESVVFLLILLVSCAMVLFVLRPAARRMSVLNDELRASLDRVSEQSRQLEDAADELETQNAELMQQQVSMESHRQLLMEMQLSAASREAQHRSVLASMAEGMLLVREDGHLVAWNAGAVRLLGSDGDGSDLSAHVETLVVEDEFGEPMASADRPFRTTLRTGQAMDGVVLAIVLPSGERRWLRVNTRLVDDLEDEQGNAWQATVITFADVSEERRTAAQLRNFSVVLEQTDQAIAMTNARLQLTWVNAAWIRITGFTPEEALGHRPGDLLHGPHTANETLERMRAAVRRGEGFEGEILNYRKDGTPFWLEVHSTPLRDARGAITSWVSVQHDVTARKALERERQQLAAALAVTTDGIGIVSVGGGLEFVNHAYARSHGERPRDLVNRAWAQRFPEDEAIRVERDIIPQVTRLGAWSGEVTGKRGDGSLFPQDLSITLLPTGGLVCVMRDTSDRKAAEEQLRVQAVRDELTQLYNRRGFFGVASERLVDARRRNAPAVLLYGDADHFKQVNDTYGHETGDKVLQIIASVLRDNLRAADVLARLGGDEFTALLVDASAEHSTAIVQKIQRALDDVSATGIVPCSISMSLGTAVFDPASNDDLDALMRRADGSLYDAKRFRKTRPTAA